MSALPVEMAPSLDLSLFHLDAGLLGLIEYRQERTSDRENPPDAEELAAVDAEIARYMEALPHKVAGVAAVFRRWDSQISAAKGEIARYQGIIANIESMKARLKDVCAAVLERQPEPKKGCRKLVGTDGSQLMLKGNGGLQPLVISDESLLPDECCRMEGWIRADVWANLWIDLGLMEDPTAYSLRRVPDNAAIRSELSLPCPACDGNPPHPAAGEGCPTCGNSGKNAVAGAYLAPRGNHVEVK